MILDSSAEHGLVLWACFALEHYIAFCEIAGKHTSLH